MNALVMGVTMGVMGVVMISVGVVAESDPAYHAVPAEPVHGYCANGGVCVEPVLCSPWYLESLYDPGAACYLGPSTPGVCCAPKKPACKYFFFIFPKIFKGKSPVVLLHGITLPYSYFEKI